MAAQTKTHVILVTLNQCFSTLLSCNQDLAYYSVSWPRSQKKIGVKKKYMTQYNRCEILKI